VGQQAAYEVADQSDSDLFTYGYRFKPWRGALIAAGEEILAYLDEVIDEDDLGQRGIMIRGSSRSRPPWRSGFQAPGSGLHRPAG
jgi:hypothetical protein